MPFAKCAKATPTYFRARSGALGGTMGLISWIKNERQWRRDHVSAFSSAVEMQADGLTLFQHQALSVLAQWVPVETVKRIALKKESGYYLVAALGRDGAELNIYPNEATIFGAKPHVWFEEWDYRTPADLLHALAKECASRAAA